MKYLIDTHIFLWMISSPEKLSLKVTKIIENKNNILFLSVASCWEVVIKYMIKKLTLPESPDIYIPKQVKENSITFLSIDYRYTLNILNIPEHHKDPFDRIIISQSIIDNIPIISKDSVFDLYDVQVIW